MHEFGHRTDFIGDIDAHMEGRIKLSTRTSYYSAGDTPAVRAFQQAAKETSTIADANTNYRDSKYIQYFRAEHEVWARAYSQWTAEQLGGPELEALRAQQRASSRTVGGKVNWVQDEKGVWIKEGGGVQTKSIYQWPDDEFSKLGPMIEGVLRERGLLD
jgi:peptidoglycan hydrolase-like protein with peptidoglycan-binding domain